jgi:hypothetical protein
MRSHSVIAILSVTVSVACGGCGRTQGLYPVFGKVLYRGQPAVGATVLFHRNGGPEPASNFIPTGVVGEDGGFRLATDVEDGAPAGPYNVLITWRDRSSHPDVVSEVSRPAPAKGSRKAAPTALKIRPTASLPSDRLKGRYSNPDRPLLKAEVKPEVNTLPTFELAD